MKKSAKPKQAEQNPEPATTKHETVRSIVSVTRVVEAPVPIRSTIFSKEARG